MAAEELQTKKPGRSVLRHLRFAGHLQGALDLPRLAYVNMDEALEMLSVRHLNSLSVNVLGHLGNPET